MTMGTTFVRQPSILGFTGACSDFVTDAVPLGDGYRWYLPSLMRFNALDSASPFGNGGPNPYAYCSNDPLNRRDPSGHFALGIVLGAVGLAISVTPYAIDAVRAGAVAFREADGPVAGIKAFAGAASRAPVDVFREAPFSSKIFGAVSVVSGVMSIGLGIAASKTSGSTSESLETFSFASGFMSFAASGFHTLPIFGNWRQALTESRAELTSTRRELTAVQSSVGTTRQDLRAALHSNMVAQGDFDAMMGIGAPPPRYTEPPPAYRELPQSAGSQEALHQEAGPSAAPLPRRYRRGPPPRAQSPMSFSHLLELEAAQDYGDALPGPDDVE